jgi:hypothetical protein
VALAAAVWAGGGSARADRLDDQLLEQAPKIVEALRGKGYRNVGVLRFRVRLGNAPETFAAGAVNGNLAVRLKSALVIYLDTDQGALGVIRDASAEAAARGVGNWYRDPAERRKLFDVPGYTLDWEGPKVRADAFLTGVLRVSADLEKAAVTVEAFSARDPNKEEKLAEFTFETDVPLLHDLGKSYAVVPRTPGAADAPRMRRLIIEAIRKQEASGSPDPREGPPADALVVGDLEFRILADGKALPIKANGQATVESPDARARVAFRLTNRSKDKTLGIDVRLNGVSLLLEQMAPPESCRVWVLKPGKSYTLRGFYLNETDLKNVAPFKVLVGAGAQKKKIELGDRAGEIQVHVFDPAPADEEPMLVSTRSLRGLRPSGEPEARRDRATLRARLMKEALLKPVVQTERQGDKVVKREIVVKDEDEEKRLSEKLRAVDFPRTPAPVASRVIKVVPGPAN